MSTTTTTTTHVNGIDVAGLQAAAEGIAADPAQGRVAFRVGTEWMGGTRSESTVESYEMAGETVKRHFAFTSDEPEELFGSNCAPNPQEYLMGALNACMMVGFVANAALRGIRLAKVEIETTGELDLRGFLGLDASVPAGYEGVKTTVRIAGDATPEQFAELHEAVRATSPNYFNFTRPVPVEMELVVE